MRVIMWDESFNGRRSDESGFPSDQVAGFEVVRKCNMIGSSSSSIPASTNSSSSTDGSHVFDRSSRVIPRVKTSFTTDGSSDRSKQEPSGGEGGESGEKDSRRGSPRRARLLEGPWIWDGFFLCMLKSGAVEEPMGSTVRGTD